MSYIIHPWNPFGDNEKSVVYNESISALGEERSLLVPRYGPFFEKDLILKDAQTGVELKPGRDFVFSYPFDEFIKYYSRTIYGGITLLESGRNRQLVLEQYKTIGEPFTQNDQDFIRLCSTIIHSERIADWSQVVNLPMEGFPADPHEHEPDLTYNYHKFIEVMKAIDQGQRTEFNNPTVASQLAEHVTQAFKLAHPNATAEDFNLGNVEDFGVATEADLQGNSDQLYLTLAKGRKLTEVILKELGIYPDDEPTAPGSDDELDQPLTLREALKLFTSKDSDLAEIDGRGKIARRNARNNLGLGDAATATIEQTVGQGLKALMSQKAITDALNLLVPQTRTINGMPLDKDIIIDVNDNDSYSRTETDNLLAKKFDKSAVSQSAGSNTSAVMSQKATTDALNAKVPNTRKVNGKPLSSDVNLSPGDVGAYTKTQVNDLVNGRVPNGRTVNGKPLSSNISLSAGDVGAYTKSEVNTRLDEKFDKGRLTGSTGGSTTYVMTQKAVTDQLNAKVPTSRTINGKPLSSNISLSAANVGAYTKSETDTRLNGKFDKSYISQGTGNNSLYVMSQKAVTDNLNKRVPTSRTVNGKALSSNITLTASDVGLSRVENKRWVKVKDASVSFNLRNGYRVYTGEVDTGLRLPYEDGRRFDKGRFRVIPETLGNITSSNANACWWGVDYEVVLKQYWNKGHQIWIKFYGSGAYISSGKISNYELYEWK
ncbi:tail fiber protein [Vibrio phage 2 TSL-2019]|uniref:Tail fiber protein n=1 Tax=Vibrio phage 2 TSL-2019 TaxID=2508172 RepID=A0A513PWG1_9CAUD|nr:tail fiber protein [Vibrio phage 2 TSL-2019]QAU04284.1 tail fiber protein [Vibrio phage 2 TSL-2019]